MGLTVSIAPAPAMASADHYRIARCAKGNYKIEVRVRYVTLETRHVFNQVSWRIVGKVGSKNTIRFIFMQDAKPDLVFKVLNYEGGKTGTRNISVHRPKSHQMYVKLGAKFDTSASSDPSCIAYTRGI